VDARHKAGHDGICVGASFTAVIVRQRVGATRRPMTGSAKQSSFLADERSWIASSLRSSQ
jgi:hypothetical protein